MCRAHISNSLDNYHVTLSKANMSHLRRCNKNDKRWWLYESKEIRGTYWVETQSPSRDARSGIVSKDYVFPGVPFDHWDHTTAFMTQSITGGSEGDVCDLVCMCTCDCPAIVNTITGVGLGGVDIRVLCIHVKWISF